MRDIDRLKETQIAELKAYAKWGGRAWKAKLRNDWADGYRSGYGRVGDTGILQYIRNHFPKAIDQVEL